MLMHHSLVFKQH